MPVLGRTSFRTMKRKPQGGQPTAVDDRHCAMDIFGDGFAQWCCPAFQSFKDSRMSQTTVAPRSKTSEAAIFSRVWADEGQPLSATLARHVLKLRFSADDQTRMHELSQKSQQGELSAEETDELDNFIRVGDLLAILQSKARRSLRKTGAAQRG